ncbi:MAG: hypothetical protein Q7S02_03320 [bacterium]|nr:hypothetical protein [bacterium]
MGIVRTFTFAIVGFVAATCSQGSETSTAAQEPPPDRAAAFGLTQSLGGSTYQWSVLIDVNALEPGEYISWYNQSCTNEVSESTRRQDLFTKRLNVMLAAILTKNPHCTIFTLSILAYGSSGCGNSDISNPSGAYVIFSCPNGEPLITVVLRAEGDE